MRLINDIINIVNGDFFIIAEFFIITDYSDESGSSSILVI
jgi:hypothetical protein